MGEKFGGWFDPDAVLNKKQNPTDLKSVLEKSLGGVAKLKQDSEDWPDGHLFVGVGLEGLKIVVDSEDGSCDNMAIPLCRLRMLCAHGIEDFIAPPSVIKEMINSLITLMVGLMRDRDFAAACDAQVEVNKVDSEDTNALLEALRRVDEILRQQREREEEEDE